MSNSSSYRASLICKKVIANSLLFNRAMVYGSNMRKYDKTLPSSPFSLGRTPTLTHSRLDSQFIAELQPSEIYNPTTQGGDGTLPPFPATVWGSELK